MSSKKCKPIATHLPLSFQIEDMANATQKTLFSDIYGKLTIQSESLVSASTQPEPLPEVSESTPFLTIPTNVLPHPSVLIQSFLSTLLVKKATPQPSSLLTDSSREIKSEDNMEEVLVPSILQRSAILSNIYSS